MLIFSILVIRKTFQTQVYKLNYAATSVLSLFRMLMFE